MRGDIEADYRTTQLRMYNFIELRRAAFCSRDNSSSRNHRQPLVSRKQKNLTSQMELIPETSPEATDRPRAEAP
jgi:hypothetical protein